MLKDWLAKLNAVVIEDGAVVSLYATGIAGYIVRRALRVHWCCRGGGENGMFIPAKRVRRKTNCQERPQGLG